MNLDVAAAPALVDTHCHLDDPVFAGNLDDILRESRQRGVTRWIVVGFTPGRWESTIAVATRHPGMAHMLGVHPGSADLWSTATSDALQSVVGSSRPVAIGEIGLDFHRGGTNLAAQLAAFHDQLDIALAHGLPAVIHMRSAETEMLRALEGRTSLPPLVFHSFDGTHALRDFVVDRGQTIGVGGLATRASSGHVRKLIRTVPLAQIVLETDAPYLIPKGSRGGYNVPGNVAVVAAALAGLLEMELQQVATATTRTADRVFGLAGGDRSG